MSLCSTLKTSHNPLIHYLESLGRGSGIGNPAISGQMSNLITLPTSCGAKAYMMKLTLVSERQGGCCPRLFPTFDHISLDVIGKTSNEFLHPIFLLGNHFGAHH
ncbi:hypothetical protein Tco_0235070, partial [Tanacetum coccineum]